jgi:hypothetical protein
MAVNVGVNERRKTMAALFAERKDRVMYHSFEVYGYCPEQVGCECLTQRLRVSKIKVIYVIFTIIEWTSFYIVLYS